MLVSVFDKQDMRAKRPFCYFPTVFDKYTQSPNGIFPELDWNSENPLVYYQVS